MDPNANLAEQLKLARQDWTGRDTHEMSIVSLECLHTQHIRLCELVEALDEWIRKGGFLPTAWQDAQ